jgi:membrane-anchored glycerophosphoryl diester phosphodiesterase (GDPDase)
MPTINGIIAGIVFGIIVFIGLILLIIPGIYLAVALYFFLIFIALEDESFIDALQSSWELTKGRRLSVFLFFIGIVLVQILFSIVGGVASLALGAAVPVLGAVVNVAVGAAFTVFSLAALYDAYTQLRGSGGPASGAGVGTGEPPVGQGDTRTR